MPGQQGAGPQPNWRYCCKCYGLFLGPSAAGVCPAGGEHDPSKSGNYTLNDALGTSVWENWYWCDRCGVLFLAFWGTGTCPASGGGGHDYATNKAEYMMYALTNSAGVPHQQPGWHACNKCHGLFFGQGTTSGMPGRRRAQPPASADLG